jgi:hypothetical protein
MIVLISLICSSTNPQMMDIVDMAIQVLGQGRVSHFFENITSELWYIIFTTYN